MTILLTADCVGGVWTYALDLMRVLPQHHFVVATMGERPSPAQRAAIGSLPNATFRESDWKLEWMEEPWAEVERAGQWLLELEREFAPDVVHLNGYSHAVLPFRAPVVVVAHSCVLSWWRAVLGEEAPAAWDCYRSYVSAGLKAANLVVSPTHALLEELAALYGAFGCSRVIYNGSAVVETAPVKRERQRFVLCAGRVWDEAKNIAMLDEVAPHLDAPIRVAGAQVQGGQEFAARHLELLGFLDSGVLFELMGEAAIWAHPARYEPFGLAPLEAAGRGCALVMSDIATLRELWDGAALLVAPDDVRGWAEALQRLLDSPDERLAWAEKAYERSRRYSLEQFGAAYDELYSELAR